MAAADPWAEVREELHANPDAAREAAQRIGRLLGGAHANA